LAEQTLRSPDFPDREDALRVLINIYEHAGQPDKALEVATELLGDLRTARQQVTQDELAGMDLVSLDSEDNVVRDLLERSAEFEVAVQRLGDRLHAKLAYLCELGVSAELREEGDAHAGEHIYRVGRLCALLAAEAGCKEEACWLAELSGRLHDIGKISLPSHLVLKRRALSTGERRLLRAHAEDGAALLAQLGEARIAETVEAVRHHHEHWNGNGYPSGLSGERIPLLARIVSICDSFDAMTHWRAYKPARSIVAALEEVERCAGEQFDPTLVGTFVTLIRRLQREQPDLDEYLGEAGRPTRWGKSYVQLMRSLEEGGMPLRQLNGP
jgi:HD-GYP domain-containing protein (c-di-GMP phosphodiesterase class II)